jgi:hypothetical protein
MTIAAKPTLYNGVRFRSRLEARWAVFFDAIGAQWTYEPSFPELAGLLYQPDFLLGPREPNWVVEVKPWPGDPADWSALALYLNRTQGDERYASVARLLSTRMLLLIGLPGLWEQGRLTGYGSVAIAWDKNEPVRGLLEWAECPKCSRINMWPDGMPLCCDRDLPTGPLYKAFAQVRDHSYEDA